MSGQTGTPNNGAAQNFLAAGSNAQNYMPRREAHINAGGVEGLRMPGMGSSGTGMTFDAGEGMRAPESAMTPRFGQPDDQRRQALAQIGMQFGQQMLQRNQMPALTPQAPPALAETPQVSLGMPGIRPGMAPGIGMGQGRLGIGMAQGLPQAGRMGNMGLPYQPNPAFRRGF